MSPLERFTQHKKWAHRVAWEVVKSRRLPALVSVDDCIQAALVALWQTCHRYREDSAATFWTYAHRRVRGAVIDEIRDARPGSRSHPVQWPLSLDQLARPDYVDLDEDPLDSSVADPDFPVEDVVCLHDAIDHLQGRERVVFDRCDLGGELLRDVAVDLGVSESRVSQIRHRAYASLRKALA